jgi:hypothetical protein
MRQSRIGWPPMIDKERFFVSITHLAFDRRLPVARKMTTYQKRRIERIRRENATGVSTAYH